MIWDNRSHSWSSTTSKLSVVFHESEQMNDVPFWLLSMRNRRIHSLTRLCKEPLVSSITSAPTAHQVWELSGAPSCLCVSFDSFHLPLTSSQVAQVQLSMAQHLSQKGLGSHTFTLKTGGLEKLKGFPNTWLSALYAATHPCRRFPYLHKECLIPFRKDEGGNHTACIPAKLQ